MKVIVAGSRTINDYKFIKKYLDDISKYCWDIDEVVSGTARGVDKLGEKWANENNIPIKRFPAKWVKYKKAAGHIRNKKMAEYADALIVFWDGESKGTKNMINEAKKLNLEIFIVRLDDEK